jgi:surfeit locus 1 family protein
MNPVCTRWVAAAAGVATVVLTAALGQWQLRRADEKVAAAALVAQRAAEPVWTESDWPCAVTSADDPLPLQRRAQLRGRWLTERTVFLDNRPMDGVTGFDVVTPLRLSAGPCTGQLVLVQRGWVPRDAADRLRLPVWQDTDAAVRVPGRVVAQVSRTYALGEEAPLDGNSRRPIRQNVDTAMWSAWIGQVPLAGALLQTEDEAMVGPPTVAPTQPTAGAPLSRHWLAMDTGVGKHRAYAAQWFAMSAILAGLTLWFPILAPRWRRRAQPSP